MGSNIYFCEQSTPHERISNYRNITQMSAFRVTNNVSFKQNSNIINNVYIPCKYLGKGVYGCSIQILIKSKKQQRLVQKIINTFYLVQDFLFFNQILFKQLTTSIHFKYIKSIKMDGCKMYILMDKFIAGDLYSIIKKKCKQIDQHFIRELVVKVVLILQKIHSKNLIYRSLRPQNILFTGKDGEFQLAELIFCLCGERATTYYGAATYTPPQVYLQKEEGYTNSIDLWMLGVLIYELLVGQTPFQAPNLSQIRQNVINFRIQNLQYPQGLKIDCNIKNLIQKLLEPDPQNRLTLQEVHRHKFFDGLTWYDYDQISYLNIKLNLQKQQKIYPNRVKYFNFTKSRPLTRQYSDIFYDQKFNTDN